MIYAEFYEKKLNGKIGPGLGDRATIILDGRHNLHTNHGIAYAECVKRGYIGYQLHIGEAFTRSKPLAVYCPVTP